MSQGRRRRSSSRGFTLVEFMVALTGGLFVSLAVFSLAKNSSRFYQREIRVGNAMLNAVTGFERLRADLSRAGYMASPNIRQDPTVCGNVEDQTPRVQWDTTLPDAIKGMQSVAFNPGTAQDILTRNGIQPDRMVLSGNYRSLDQYPIRQVVPTGGGDYTVRLQFGLELAELGYFTGAGTELAAVQDVFRAGKAVRLVDKRGATQYGVVLRVTANGGNPPVITLRGGVGGANLFFMDTSPFQCGFHGNETGGYINPVNFIMYDTDTAVSSNYTALYANNGPEYDFKYYLVRRELAITSKGNSWTWDAADFEPLAENAVDLRFQITVARTENQVLENVAAADRASWAGWKNTPEEDYAPGLGPQRIRAVRAWLSVRSREADREVGVSSQEAGSPLYRIGLGANGGAPFARVRTIQAYIAMHNQVGITW